MLFGESENAVALTARAALLTPLRVVGLRPVQPAAGLTTGGTVLSAAPTFQFDRCSTAKRMTEPLIGFALVSNSIYSRSILQCTKGSSLMEMQQTAETKGCDRLTRCNLPRGRRARSQEGWAQCPAGGFRSAPTPSAPLEDSISSGFQASLVAAVVAAAAVAEAEEVAEAGSAVAGTTVPQA